MVYIYDIVLNFNKEKLEIFEWLEKDDIKYIKKIPLYKVSSNMLKDIINNDVKIDINFCNKIKDNMFLVSNDKLVLGILINNKGIIEKVSSLLLDEEEEVLKVSERLNEEVILYQIINAKENKLYLTRKEKDMVEELKKELAYLYNNNKIDKLNYYYYEYFNLVSNNKEEVYQSLINSLKNLNSKHIKLYEITKLSYQKK